MLDLTLQLAYSGWLGGLGLSHISQVRGKNTIMPGINLPSFSLNFSSLKTDWSNVADQWHFLLRILICGFVPLTNGSWFGSGSGSCSFRQWPYYFLKLHCHHFPKIKSHKEVTNRRNQSFSYYFGLMIEGSGAFWMYSKAHERRSANVFFVAVNIPLKINCSRI